MNRMRAIAILRRWTVPGIIPLAELAELQCEALDGESPLDTAVRLGNGGFALPRPAAFDFAAVERLANELEICAFATPLPGESVHQFEARAARAARRAHGEVQS